MAIRQLCSCYWIWELIHINERNLAGETALLEAIDYKQLSCVKILTERGADTTTSRAGRTVLHRVVLAGDVFKQVMKFLLDAVETRRLVDAVDSHGNTALHCCSAYSDCVSRLGVANMLVQAGASLTIKNTNRQTPYGYARYRGEKELAKYLWSQLSPEKQVQERPLPPDW